MASAAPGAGAPAEAPPPASGAAAAGAAAGAAAHGAAGDDVRGLLRGLTAGAPVRLLAQTAGPGARQGLALHPDASVAPKSIVVPGSFNPMHEGHEALARAAWALRAEEAQAKKPEVFFELCVVNADKGSLAVEEVERRLREIVGRGHRALVTRAALFRDKALMCRDCDFVVGYDTYQRIVDAKYYAPAGRSLEAADEPERRGWVLGALSELRALGVRLLVAGRVEEDGTFLDLDSTPAFELPQDMSDLILPLRGFRLDISSTALRRERQVPP